MLSPVETSLVRGCVTLVLALLLVLVLLVASVSNALVVVLFVRRRGMRTLPNRFVLNLSTVNLSSALALLPLLLTDLLLLTPSVGLCQAVDAAAAFVVSASVLATLLIAGDRYVAVTDALRYHALVTHPRSVAAIAGCWLGAALVAALSTLVPAAHKPWESCAGAAGAAPRRVAAQSYTAALAMLMFVGPVAALVVMYIRIYHCAHKNSARQRRNSLGINPADLAAPMIATARLGMRGGRAEAQKVQALRHSSTLIVNNLKHKISNASLFMYREEGRTAKVSLVVVCLFFACWLPYFLAQTVAAFVAFSPTVMHVAALLAAANSALSPFVYSFRSRRTQRELRRLCGLRVSQKAAHAPRALRRTLTNPTPFPLMDTIPSSPLDTSGHFTFSAASGQLALPAHSFLYTLTRKSSSVPSINAAAALQTAASAGVCTFAAPPTRLQLPPTCDLPRGSISSDSSTDTQASGCTDQTDASGR